MTKTTESTLFSFEAILAELVTYLNALKNSATEDLIFLSAVYDKLEALSVKDIILDIKALFTLLNILKKNPDLQLEIFNRLNFQVKENLINHAVMNHLPLDITALKLFSNDDDKDTIKHYCHALIGLLLTVEGHATLQAAILNILSDGTLKSFVISTSNFLLLLDTLKIETWPSLLKRLDSSLICPMIYHKSPLFDFKYLTDIKLKGEILQILAPSFNKKLIDLYKEQKAFLKEFSEKHIKYQIEEQTAIYNENKETIKELKKLCAYSLSLKEDEERKSAKKEDEIGSLYYDPNASADDLYQVGLSYLNGINKNYDKAVVFFKAAKQKGHVRAITKLGICYEYGWGLEKNFINAADYYRAAIDGGDYKANDRLSSLYWTIPFEKISRAELKIFERKRIIWDAEKDPENFLNKKDVYDNTPFHRAVEASFFNTAVRLRLMNTQYSSFLSSPLLWKQQLKLEKLQMKLLELLYDIERPAPEVLRDVMIVRGKFFKNTLLDSLDELYKMSEIKPLMDLAKLAVLGYHRLSCSKHLSDDYDSDNDAEPNDHSKKLKIVIDVNSQTTEKLRLFDNSNHDETQSYGCYDYHLNSIYIGCDKRPLNEIMATLIHEVTHFVADEIFSNLGAPYFSNTANQVSFWNIILKLKKDQASIHPILANAFTYDENKYPSELIARTAEITVTYSNGLTILEKQAPQLLTYYRDIFLTEIAEHIRTLEERLFRHWPKELLLRSFKTEYISPTI